MAEQENKDWLDKLGEFFSRIFINPNSLMYFMVHLAFHFIANISRQKVIMSGLLIQINQLGNNI